MSARPSDRTALALAAGLEVWLYTEADRPDAAELLVGTEAVVRARVLQEIGEPSEYALRRVTAGGTCAAELADALAQLERARAQVAELDARCDRLTAERDEARKATVEREKLHSGPPLRETPEWPAEMGEVSGG